MQSPDDQTRARKAWLGLLARSPADRVSALCPDLPEHDVLRPAEIGTVMVRGRAGATGDAFNLGEMTVTRCSVRLASGTVGHGYVQGRDRSHARKVAVLDALMQGDRAEEIRSAVLDPLAREAADRRSVRAGRAAGTRVDFFTMVRGEDA